MMESDELETLLNVLKIVPSLLIHNWITIETFFCFKKYLIFTQIKHAT